MSDEISLIILLSVGAAFSLAWLIFMREQLNMKWYVAIPLAILHTLCGVLSVKIFAFLETGFNSESLGNMSLFGGVFMMPLTYMLGAKISKRNMSEVWDIFTPCMLVTVMFARVGCIIGGCCKGIPIPGLGGVRVPTREAEVIFYIVLLILLCPRIVRKQTGGRAYPVYMMAYGVFRFVTEFLRESDNTTIFHRAHIWSLITLILGVCIYVEINNRKINTRRRIKK